MGEIFAYGLECVLTFVLVYIEFIKLVGKSDKSSASLAFYLFSSTRLINSIKHEHSFKVLYLLHYQEPRLSN